MLTLKIKKGALAACVIAAVFCLSYFPAYHASMNASILPEKDPDLQIPWSHWIMMGLRGNGNYYDPDYKLTLAAPADQREEFVRQEIANRIREYGFSGMLDHLSVKNSFVWNEGTYFSANKVMRDRIATSSLDKYLLFEGPDFYLYGYWCQFLMMVTVSGFLLSAAQMLFGKKETRLLPFSLCAFGLFLFQMMWEARSRYLFNFLPVFIVIVIVGWTGVFESRRKRT